jgi:hypothetical protein
LTTTPHPRLGEILLNDGLLTQDQLDRGLEQKRASGGRLGRHLLRLGFVTESALLDALGKQLQIRRIDLTAPGAIAADAARYARVDLADQWGFCPVEFDTHRGILIVALPDPDPQLLRDIEGFLALRIEPRLASSRDVERATGFLYRGEPFPVENGAPPHLDPGPPTPAPQLDRLNAYDAVLAQQLVQQPISVQRFSARPGVTPLTPTPTPFVPAGPTLAPLPPGPIASGAVAVTPAPFTPPPAPSAIPLPGAESLVRKFQPSPAETATAGTSPEELIERLNRLERMLVTQTNALRALVEVLVDKGVLTKVEMARKQMSGR